MSPQRLLCPLWHESLAQPLTSWVSGGPTMAASCTVARPPWISVKLTPQSRKPRAHQPYSSPDHRGDFDGEKPVKVPTVFEVRKVLFTRAGCAILRNPFRGVICPVGGVAGRYDRRK